MNQLDEQATERLRAMAADERALADAAAVIAGKALRNGQTIPFICLWARNAATHALDAMAIEEALAK